MSKADLLRELEEKGRTVGSVESLTAGLFGATYASIPGASKTYKGGIISYCAEVKHSCADVPLELIEEKGVVSAEVAEAMALGGKANLHVDICLSCTGNAGPTCEKGGAPVGSVYIGYAVFGAVHSQEFHFEGDRNAIRQQVVEKMFEILEEICK